MLFRSYSLGQITLAPSPMPVPVPCRELVSLRMSRCRVYDADFWDVLFRHAPNLRNLSVHTLFYSASLRAGMDATWRAFFGHVSVSHLTRLELGGAGFYEPPLPVFDLASAELRELSLRTHALTVRVDAPKLRAVHLAEPTQITYPGRHKAAAEALGRLSAATLGSLARDRKSTRLNSSH